MLMMSDLFIRIIPQKPELLKMQTIALSNLNVAFALLLKDKIKINMLMPFKFQLKLKSVFLFLLSCIIINANAQAPTNDDPCNAIELTPSTACNFATYSTLNATGTTVPQWAYAIRSTLPQWTHGA